MRRVRNRLPSYLTDRHPALAASFSQVSVVEFYREELLKHHQCLQEQREYFSEQAYIGVLFVLGAVALFAFALRLWRGDDVPSWLLGAITMAGMGVGFVLSRTVGLPGFHESEWELSGLICLVLEAGFVGVAARALAPAEDRRALAA